MKIGHVTYKFCQKSVFFNLTENKSLKASFGRATEYLSKDTVYVL